MMDCPLNLADEMAKNALALHDAQMEIERDGPISQTGNGTPCTKVGLQDFELLSVVGQGAFGKVRGLGVLRLCPVHPMG
jgi:hypothetical protein